MNGGSAQLGLVEEKCSLRGTELGVSLGVNGWNCGVAYASFSKVTVADCLASASPETGVMERETILPLSHVSMCQVDVCGRQGCIPYQKLKKSRTSFSEVVEGMPETWTVE